MFELAWRCNINDTCEKLSPLFDDHTFPQDQVHFWRQPFRSIPNDELLEDEQRRSVFDWFGNECATFSNAVHKHRDVSTYESLRGKTPKAVAANEDLQRTVQIITWKVKHGHDCGAWLDGEYTFCIENPSSSALWDMKEMWELRADPQVKATIIEITQCLFGGRAIMIDGQLKGPPEKATSLLTNNPALVHYFGTADKRWFPNAPDPKFECGKGNACQYIGRHRVICQDQPAKDTAAYPRSFSMQVALLVNNWWRTAYGCKPSYCK